MKLSRIDWLKECGHFRNYEWDSSLPEFKQVNVIYGANGTGKSSFSSAFEELKGGEESSFKKVSLTFADSKGSQTATTTDGKYSEIFERIMVYGDRFIEKGHRFKQDPELEAVLTIGARSVEQEERLQEIEDKLAQAEKERDLYEAEEKRANEAIKGIYTRVSQSVVDSIAAAGGRWKSRNSYNSRKVQQAYDSRSSEWSSLTEGELQEIISLINSPKQEALQDRNLRVNVSSDLIDRLKKCLKSTPISTVLDTLEDHPEASSWVQQGFPMHKELDHCIFCAGALSDERKRAIEEHFSDAVEKLQKEIHSITEELALIEKACSDKVRSLFDKGLLFADLRDSYVTEKANLEDQYKRLENSAKKTRLVATEKLQNVLLPVNDEITTLPSLDVAPVEKFYATHNDRVLNRSRQIDSYARVVEEHFLKEHLDNFLTEENRLL